MQLAAKLAKELHTPIPYFLSLPLRELVEWADVAGEVRGKGAK
ncbi:hypothetical protein [Paenibacillus sp. GCM10027626]